MKITLNKLKSDHRGLVSIIVTMMLMVVITMIVLGFAQLSRREQRQAIDKQLSTQAFYAAESGINAAKDQIMNNGYNASKTDCNNSAPFTGDVGTDSNVKYTCLLINQTPSSLIYSPVAAGEAISADIRFVESDNVTPATAGYIVIRWSAPNPSAGTFSSANSFNTFRPLIGGAPNWAGQTALARLDLTNFNNTLDDYSRPTLNGSTLTAFLYPTTTAGNTLDFTSHGPTDQGQIIPGTCNAGTGICSVRVNNINTRHAFIRLGSIYADSKFTITAFDSGGLPLNMTGGQAVIDSTGRAQDVLRRIQVRLPLGPGGKPMSYAVESATGVCKDITVGVGFGSQTDATDDACKLSP